MIINRAIGTTSTTSQFPQFNLDPNHAMFEDWSNAVKLGSKKKYDRSVTCLANDPENLAIRSNRRRTSDILSQTNKQEYNKYSSNAHVKVK